MYKELKKLRKYTENLNDAIHLVYSHMRNSDDELRNEDISEIIKLTDKLKKKDIYILLEVIYSTSLTFQDSLMNELEEKYSYLVFKWGDVYKKYHADEDEFDLDFYQWLDVIHEQLIESIDNINRFCINYLSKTKSSLFSGVENIIIAVAHKDYLKAKQRYYELRHYGINALTKEDHFNMLMLEIDNSEQYVEGLISEGIEFDITKYEIEFENIERIEEVVIQDEFQVCFVSDRKAGVNSVEDEYTIEAVRNYLQDEGIMAKTPLNIFHKIIKDKHLPQNANQVLWLEKYVDAINLINFFNLTIEEFNECFVCKKGSKLNAKNHQVKGGSGYTDFYYFLDGIKCNN